MSLGRLCELSARKSGKTDSDEKNVTRYAIGEGDETDLCSVIRQQITFVLRKLMFILKDKESKKGYDTMPLLKTKLYTIDDIYALPDGKRAELLDGRIL